MTAQTKATLRLVFETGDVPDGSNYTDMIDSAVNLAESTVQTMSGPLVVTVLGASEVSASTGKFGTVAASGGLSAARGEFGVLGVTGDVSAVNAQFKAVAVSGGVSAATGQFGTLEVSGNATFSAASITLLTLTGFVTAQVTASVQNQGGAIMRVPTTAAGYFLVQVCGKSVGIPYFNVS